jgi:hypothetical protein
MNAGTGVNGGAGGIGFGLRFRISGRASKQVCNTEPERLFVVDNARDIGLITMNAK